MTKRLTYRLSALALALWLALSLSVPVWAAPEEIPSGPADAAAPENTVTITISKAEDLCQLAKDCALDAWSRDKTVVLTAGLDLTGADFTPIPTFGGVFDGQGHAISGLSLTASGSTVGLFRYVQPGAAVRNLTVKGTVAPEGTRSTVGGIAGRNAGTLQNCAFSGTVRGESAVGGIAGHNEAQGQIIGCTVSGSVSGQDCTGGVAGRNAGLLLNCANRAGVNLTRSASDQSGEEAVLEELASGGGGALRLTDGCADTGGIAGLSDGVVQSCVNDGDVGYPHVGYNTGGVVGRQSGYLAGCVNNGTIHGRKDVGGVVGQAEPWLVLDPGPQTLDRLRAELDTLDRLINRALSDAGSTGDRISARLTAMGGFTDAARESSKRLLDRAADFVDENVAEVNTLAADVTNALDKISPALDDLSGAGERLDRLSQQLDRALQDLEGAAETGGTVFDVLRSSAGDLRQSRAELDAAVQRFRAALDAVRDAVFPDGSPSLPSREELAAIRAEIHRAFDSVKGAGNRLDGALTGLQRAMEAAGDMPGQLGDALEDLQDTTQSSAAIGRLLKSAFRSIGDGVDQLTQNGPARFTSLGEEAREAGGSLYDALGGLSVEMEELNRAVQSGNHTLTSDLRAVSRQFSIICNVMMDAVDNLDQRRQEGGLVQDTSDEDIAATREGKAADCTNTGAVEGDRNVGGVAGAVAVEVDLDPEDDIELSLGATYETKAVLQGCVNRGSVTAKKDCAGGVAGRMDLGAALDCQSYGPVTSTGGNYVGGIAGWADASIRSCWAKNTLSGGNYVGGVAGWTGRLRDCRAIATILEGTEYLGAVAGWAEEGGVLSGNRFVDTGWAGVDGVSYAGRAEPVPFEELAALPDAPAEFTAFTLTLTADGETAARLPFFYGDDLTRLTLPEVPEKEGCYGVWPTFDASGVRSDVTVEAVYTPWVTLLASRETREGKLAMALAEGRFTEEAVLHVQPALSSTAPTEGVLWDVSLTGADLEQGEEVALRLLNTTGGRAEVRRYQDGQWVLLDAEANGSYLIVTMRGPRGTFNIAPAQGVPWLIPAAVSGVAALAALALMIGKRQRVKKNAKAPEKQAEPEAK